MITVSHLYITSMLMMINITKNSNY